MNEKMILKWLILLFILFDFTLNETNNRFGNRKIAFKKTTPATDEEEGNENEANEDNSDEKDNNCDDGVTKIGVDWNGEDKAINPDVYKCNSGKNLKSANTFAKSTCYSPPMSVEVCMNRKIVFLPGVVPIGGPHRSVMPAYGAAVFLYNPCSVKEEVDAFKQIAKSCMKKHIITPYKNLPKGEIFNVVTYGCRLALTKVTGSEKAIYEFLKKNANKGPEKGSTDGKYNFGLVQKAKTIPGQDDNDVCNKT